MLVFEIIIALLLLGAGLTAVSRRIGTPYPAMLALAGAAIALIPGTPKLVLDPELALTLFVAPVLLDSAFDAPQRDLRSHWRSVASLAVGAVILTVVAVALVVRFLVPAMPWSVAITIGAIVAPPDAAAATAVLKQLRPPHRLLVVLEGESLFNDASALLVYRLAAGVAVAGVLSPMHAVPLLVFGTAGSVILGLVLAPLFFMINRRIEDVGIGVVVQFCGTFAVWMLAEHLHLSGILTVVVFAMATARRVSSIIPARIRIPTYAVWEFAVFVLNVLAFILVGFQLKDILERIDRQTLLEYGAVAGAVCVAAVVARIVYVAGAAAISRWRQTSSPHRGGVGLSNRAAVVVGWCGMRGIVTLAAALALPSASADSHAFPYRDLIVLIAFAVVLGTLVIQGMTLGRLIKWLALEDDGEVEREVRLARVETLRAAIHASAGAHGEIADVLRRRYELLLARAEARLATDPTSVPAERLPKSDADVVRAATSAERQRLLALRADGTIGEGAFQLVEQELDWEELYLQRATEENSAA